MPTSRRLEDITWTDVRDLLAQGTRTVIVMTASMEQHGPHLPTMTDTAIGYTKSKTNASQRCIRRLGYEN